MQTGFRGGGHHHHHHHRVGGALLAGAIIGSAARRNRQPDVVVVNQGGGDPYQQTVHVQSEQPKKKRKVMSCLCCVIFAITILLCMTLIAFPGSYHRTLVMGAQLLDTSNGHFVESVSTTASNAAVSLFVFDKKPSRGVTKNYSMTLPFPTQRFQWTSMQFDLLKTSTVNANWVYDNPSCPMEFIVIRGAGRFDSFKYNGYTHYDHYEVFTTSSSYLYTATYDDSYYFIFLSSICSGVSGSATLNVNADSYDTSTAIKSCSAQGCSYDQNYGEVWYVMLEAPTDQGSNVFDATYVVDGRWYTYTALYVGLFVGLCLCTSVGASMDRKKQQQDEERSPLIHSASASAPTYSETVTQQQQYPPAEPQYYAEPVYSAQPSAPPPYEATSPVVPPQPQMNFDPYTGQRLN